MDNRTVEQRRNLSTYMDTLLGIRTRGTNSLGGQHKSAGGSHSCKGKRKVVPVPN
jgi:hypothetical protein